MTRVLALLCGLALGAAPALAASDETTPHHAPATTGDPHAGHAMPAGEVEAASTRAFRAANDRMHAAMAVPFSGDADMDFVRGMIGHHQGAIDMARIVLEHGIDPGIRSLAEEIVRPQEAEIATMRGWLAERGLEAWSPDSGSSGPRTE